MTSTVAQFRTLHRDGTFLMPNPFDVGSARLLSALGFSALATTSSGLAATLGQLDMTVNRQQLVEHVAALTAVTDLGLNVDAERCYAMNVDGIGETVELLAGAGAAGFSIEDWDPQTRSIDDPAIAVARVRAAVAAAAPHGLVVTARCENHLHGVTDLGDTLRRLGAYLDAGADVVYAPGLFQPADIERVVALGAPVNVLFLPGRVTIPQLTDLGVRRISLGGLLANTAYGAVVDAARSLQSTGSLANTASFLDPSLRDQAFGQANS